MAKLLDENSLLAVKQYVDGHHDSTKVDTVSGKGLSTNDYTTTEKNKLAGIASGAEVNVQADWSVTDSTSDAYIKNKPSIPSAQVNSDWNASSGVAQILNKPSLGSAASKNTGTSSGNVPVLDSNGKLSSSVLPAIAITDTFVVNSQASMLALTAEIGDVCVRTDLNKSFILKTEGASTLSHWQELLTPTDAVTSVNGQTGAVTFGYLTSASKSGSTLTVYDSAGNSYSLTDTDTNTWRPLGTGANDACAGNDSRLSNSRPASDVYAWAKASTKPSYSASEVGALANYGSSPTSSSGTVVQPDGANAVSMRTGATSGRDVGIFRLSDDNAYVCNSSDNGYLFAAFDTDKTLDFSTASNAAFVVLSDHSGVEMKGDLTVAGSITSGGSTVAKTSDIPTFSFSNGVLTITKS